MATAAKTDSLAAAMTRAFAQIEGATKSANNPHFKSKYADLSAVIDAIKPALIANDLFFTQSSHAAEDGVCIETIIHHSGGDTWSCGKLFVPANKRDAQGFGSALTYARRYALMTAFGVPAEDDDGNAAAKSAPANDRKVPDEVRRAKIDDGQWATLVQMIEAKGADTEAFCKWLGVDSLRDIPACDFFKAKEGLSKKPDKAPNPQRDEVLADEIPY